MNYAKDAIEFDKESRRLLKDIHLFDVLRSDKSISSHGLEPRTPFLDRTWVQYYLSIDPSLRFHPGNTNQCEKFLLRTAFSEKYFVNKKDMPLLPDNILWRKKEAFSDGVSKTTRSLFQIIQESIPSSYSSSSSSIYPNKHVVYSHNCPDTQEKIYYRHLFESSYPGLGTVVPYFWMPKFIQASDPSARTLEIYTSL